MISGANSLYMRRGVSSRPAAAGTMEACRARRRRERGASEEWPHKGADCAGRPRK